MLQLWGMISLLLAVQAAILKLIVMKLTSTNPPAMWSHGIKSREERHRHLARRYEQIDFYDQPKAVEPAVEAITRYFQKNLR